MALVRVVEETVECLACLCVSWRQVQCLRKTAADRNVGGALAAVEFQEDWRQVLDVLPKLPLRPVRRSGNELVRRNAQKLRVVEEMAVGLPQTMVHTNACCMLAVEVGAVANFLATSAGAIAFSHCFFSLVSASWARCPSWMSKNNGACHRCLAQQDQIFHARQCRDRLD